MKIPTHLERFSWYSPHLAWLRREGFRTDHEPLPGDAQRQANLTGADLSGDDLRDVDLRFANLTDVDLTGADMRDANLTGANLTGSILRGTNMRGADMEGSNLRSADMAGADMTGAYLSGASLRDAYLPGDASIPTIENIDRKILDAVTAPGCSLEMRTWHTCATTHCRAGWAIHIAGDAGRRLEEWFGSGVAGLLIYAKSRPTKPIPNFCETNEEALADLVKCAAEGGAE